MKVTDDQLQDLLLIRDVCRQYLLNPTAKLRLPVMTLLQLMTGYEDLIDRIITSLETGEDLEDFGTTASKIKNN